MQLSLASLLVALCVASLPAQWNTIAGLDGSLTDNTNPTYWGRRGPAYPNGEVAMSYTYTMCNPGTVNIQWQTPMNPNHPMFAMMIVRETNGRFEQITSNETTYVKHAWAAANSASTCGGTCQSSGSGLRINCTDTYGVATNANRYWLAPAEEIDPWTGIWEPVGSYFDRGDPEIAPPYNTNGQRSLTNSQISAFDDVKNRITLKEQDLLTPGRFYYCCHIVCRGEDGDNHWNNIGYREFTSSYNAPDWSWSNAGNWAEGTVLNQWAGASITSARNGDDDGHFLVAVKVDALGGGMWHYEYAVQNFDNARGGASFRLPMCPTTALSNVTFRDTNDNLLDEWTWSRSGAELAFLATATNPLNWNSIYNFGFDCDVAPDSGDVVIDQARLGPGALSVTVQSTVPGGLASVTTLGAGCGAPVPALGTTGLPVIPSPGFALTVATQPASTVVVFVALGSQNVELAPGCYQYLSAPVLTHGFYVADSGGAVTAPFAIPNVLGLEGLELHWQAAEIRPGGPVLGALALSNGITTLMACR